MLDHTAYPFYRTFISNPNPRFTSYSADRFFLSLYLNCSTESKRIRYCPKCVRIQWETFGTAYWQILPQINGYEICPVHLEPIRETAILHTDIMHRFFPANCVLSDMKPIENTSRLRWIESHWDAFLQMAQDIRFISCFSVSSFLLGVRIRKVLLYDLLPVRKKWEKSLEYDPVLDLCSSEHLGEYIASLAYDHYKLSTQIPYLPAFLQLRICRILFGDIQRFVSRKI